MLRHPSLVRTAQRVIDAGPGINAAWQRSFLAGFSGRLAAALAELSPDLVVGNHGWLATALTMAQRRHGLRIPVVTYVTEPLDANALWSEPRLERAVTASTAARDDLVRLGVPAGAVDVIGYPVQRRFRDAPPRREARAQLGLEDRFTCVVSLGAEGIAGRPAEVARALAGTGSQVVVIVGRNERLAGELRAATADLPGVAVRGFVEDMERYLAAADVFVGKAGPASVMETLAVGRPLVITAYAGLNERRVVEFVQARGLGELATRPDALVGAVERLRADPSSRRETEDRIDALGFDRMANALGRYLIHYARTGAPPDTLSEAGLA